MVVFNEHIISKINSKSNTLEENKVMKPPNVPSAMDENKMVKDVGYQNIFYNAVNLNKNAENFMENAYRQMNELLIGAIATPLVLQGAAKIEQNDNSLSSSGTVAEVLNNSVTNKPLSPELAIASKEKSSSKNIMPKSKKLSTSSYNKNVIEKLTKPNKTFSPPGKIKSISEAKNPANLQAKEQLALQGAAKIEQMNNSPSSYGTAAEVLNNSATNKPSASDLATTIKEKSSSKNLIPRKKKLSNSSDNKKGIKKLAKQKKIFSPSGKIKSISKTKKPASLRVKKIFIPTSSKTDCIKEETFKIKTIISPRTKNNFVKIPLKKSGPLNSSKSVKGTKTTAKSVGSKKASPIPKKIIANRTSSNGTYNIAITKKSDATKPIILKETIKPIINIKAAVESPKSSIPETPKSSRRNVSRA